MFLPGFGKALLNVTPRWFPVCAAAMISLVSGTAGMSYCFTKLISRIERVGYAAAPPTHHLSRTGRSAASTGQIYDHQGL
jgi:hypothetical protein